MIRLLSLFRDLGLYNPRSCVRTKTKRMPMALRHLPSRSLISQANRKTHYQVTPVPWPPRSGCPAVPPDDCMEVTVASNFKLPASEPGVTAASLQASGYSARAQRLGRSYESGPGFDHDRLPRPGAQYRCAGAWAGRPPATARNCAVTFQSKSTTLHRDHDRAAASAGDHHRLEAPSL